MKNLLLLFLTFSCYSFALTAQEINHRYYDQKGKQITKSAQRQLFNLNRGGIISVPIDKEDWVEHRLVPRSKQGTLSEDQNLLLKEYLTQLYSNPLPQQYEAVIRFYPGKDATNSTGSATQNDYARIYNRLERKFRKWKTPLPFYVFKSAEGIERQSKDRHWQQDPDNFMEKTFFPYHYRGSSYVIVDNKGRFKAYFGESTTKGLLETVRQVRRKNNQGK